jgi:ADP-ribose pyrophosphatase
MPDGREAEFDIRNEGPSVSILAFTPDQKVIIAKQYRPGPGKVILDLPCGALEKNEIPLEGAARELLEETGYAGELTEVGTCYEDSYSTKIRHNFIALNCSKIQDPAGDENEFIEPVLHTLAEFRVLLRSGELTVVETGYLGLEKLGLL